MSEVSPATILVVDDNRLVRELVRDAFVAAGYRVIAVEGGLEALQQVGLERPDLIISDVAMPDFDGFALCETLKSDPETRDVPFVFLASQREVPERVRGLSLGAYDYLLKPFAVEELLVRVKLIFDRLRGGSGAGDLPKNFLAGHTSHLPIADLVQLLNMNAKTGCLRLRSREQGRVHFREGTIVGAFTARTRGLKALYRMMAWSEADFHFDPIDDPALVEPLGQSTQRLVMDAMVALDDLARIEPSLPPATVPIVLTSGVRELLAKPPAMTAVEVAVLRSARERFSLREMLDRLEAIDLEVAQAVQTLIARGAIAPLASASPAAQERESR